MSRIYYVSAPDFGKHLVRANTPHQAVALVAKEMFQVRVASQDDIVYEISHGNKVKEVLNATNEEMVAVSQENLV
jgi:Trm5-related predicted tRNA methylase